MSSLPNSRVKHSDRHDSNSNTQESSSIHEHNTASEFRSTPDRNYALTWPATRSTSHQPSEASGTTMLGGFHDGGMFDNASSTTLQDEFPWHEVRVNKYMQKIPSTIVPALLQGITNLSPSRSSLDREEEGGSREVDEESSGSGAGPRYSAAQKGKWKARTDGDIMHGSRRVRSPSPRSHFDRVRNVSFFVVFSIGGTGSNSHWCSLLRTGFCIPNRFCKISRTVRRHCRWDAGSRFQYVCRGLLAHTLSDAS